MKEAMPQNPAEGKKVRDLKEAMLWGPAGGKKVRCKLCNHRCLIPDGGRGFCLVRENKGGKLYSLVYGKAVSWEVDPIEKKPFYHWFPGTQAFSFATVGCNFRCEGCQNWSISQTKEITGHDMPPEEIIRLAKQFNARGIAYTYTEPTIFFEYAYDTAALGRKNHLYSVFVTNGYMTPETIKEMKNIDASRIDLKFMDEKLYRAYCKAEGYEHVLESIKLLHKKGHIEVINLVIPTLNDNDDAYRATAKFVAGLGKDIPLHFIAFYPANRATGIPPTHVQSLERAREIGMEEGLNYAYIGNIPGHPGENTYCPKCKGLVIERYGFMITKYAVTKDHKCPKCGGKILIWDETNYNL